MKLNLQIDPDAQVFFYYNDLKKVSFENGIIFKYEIKNGIGSSFILKNYNNYYLFFPFGIKKFKTLNQLQNYLESLKE